MRILALLSALLACGGPTHGPQQPGNTVAEAAEFPALRFVPAKPTYLLAAHTVADAQRALVDIVESFGMVAGITRSEVSHELERLLSIDPLSPDVGGKLGVDLAGGFVVYSEALEPTFVIHLSAPEAAKAFFDHLLDQGIRTQSVI